MPRYQKLGKLQTYFIPKQELIFPDYRHTFSTYVHSLSPSKCQLFVSVA